MIDNSVEVTRISSRGIWLKTSSRKFFLSYYDFPRFQNKSVQAVLHVKELAPGLFSWPELGIQLEQDTIELMHKPVRHTAVI